jgi:hypothetical protein
MRIRVFIGAFIAAMLVGIGVLAGTLMGSGNAAAQGPAQVPTAAPSAPKADTTPAPQGNQGKGGPGGMNGGRGPGGFGGFGPGMRGGPGPGSDGFGYGFGFGPGGGPQGGANANSATRAISSTTNLITQVKSDLAYANGKMDTTDVQRWVDGADSLLKSAQDANSGSKYGQAVGYARAAGELAEVADTAMAQKLGADKLPSYSQRPQFQRPNPIKPANPNNGNNGTSTTVTQAEASRILEGTYNQLVMEGALVKNATNAGDATTYLTDAQKAYTTAYNAYQSGNYSDAVASARLAEQLGGVANAVLQATTAPNDSTTPVTVPAPNF